MAGVGDDVPRVYANVVQVTSGPYDVALTFGRMDGTVLPGDEPLPPSGPSMEPVVEVFMSLGHAKTMLPILAKVIAQYEAQFGEIPAPGFEDFSKE